jgi:hypothetical protein
MAAEPGRSDTVEEPGTRAEPDSRVAEPDSRVAELDSQVAELGSRVALDTKVEPDRPVEAHHTPVAALAAGLHKRVAGPARLRTREVEHKAAALPVRLRTPVEHYIAAEPHPVRFHKLVERRRPAAAVRPVLPSTGPAEGRRPR